MIHQVFYLDARFSVGSEIGDVSRYWIIETQTARIDQNADRHGSDGFGRREERHDRIVCERNARSNDRFANREIGDYLAIDLDAQLCARVKAVLYLLFKKVFYRLEGGVEYWLLVSL